MQKHVHEYQFLLFDVQEAKSMLKKSFMKMILIQFRFKISIKIDRNNTPFLSNALTFGVVLLGLGAT